MIPFRRLVHRRRRADERAPEGVRGRLTFSELRVGDYVVHEDHGVARFAGFETREVGGITRDYLYLEYKGEDRVYVPTDQFAKLSRYSGAAGSPTLSALGGKKWLNLKARASRAAAEIAGELVNLYAERRTRKGHAFPADSEWQMSSRRPSPTARPLTRSRRSRRSRPTWSPTARWTGWSAATSATARPRSRSGLRSRPPRTAGR